MKSVINDGVLTLGTDESNKYTGAPMSPYFAVFNCHCNNARKRADKSFIKKFGQEKFDEIMTPLYKNGIMVIFHDDPTEFTKFWVDECTKFVNEYAVPETADAACV